MSCLIGMLLLYYSNMTQNPPQTWSIYLAIDHYADSSLPENLGAVEKSLKLGSFLNNSGWGFHSTRTFYLHNEDANLKALTLTLRQAPLRNLGAEQYLLIYIAGYESREGIHLYDAKDLLTIEHLKKLIEPFSRAGVRVSIIIDGEPLGTYPQSFQIDNRSFGSSSLTLLKSISLYPNANTPDSSLTDLLLRQLFKIRAGLIPARALLGILTTNAVDQIIYQIGDPSHFPWHGNNQTAPLTWTTTKNGLETILVGPPDSNIGPGAVFEIQMPKGREKIRTVIKRREGPFAWPDLSPQQGQAIPNGAPALLISTGAPCLQRRFTLLKPGHPNGLSHARVQAVTRRLSNRPQSLGMTLSPEGGNFAVGTAEDGRTALFDRAGRLLSRIDASPADEIEQLFHLLHRYALVDTLKSYVGVGYYDQMTIKARVLPAGNRLLWESETIPYNQPQFATVNQEWHLEIGIDSGAPEPLLITVLWIDSDGSAGALPAFQGGIYLKPGQRYCFPETFISKLPMTQPTRFFIFGTPKNTPIDWQSLLTIPKGYRGKNPLQELYQTNRVGISRSNGDTYPRWTKTELPVFTKPVTKITDQELVTPRIIKNVP